MHSILKPNGLHLYRKEQIAHSQDSTIEQTKPEEKTLIQQCTVAYFHGKMYKQTGQNQSSELTKALL